MAKRLDNESPEYLKLRAELLEAEIAPFRSWARQRGWSPEMRLLSSAGNGFKTDLGMQAPDGGQLPGVSVFARGDFMPRRSYPGSK